MIDPLANQLSPRVAEDGFRRPVGPPDRAGPVENHDAMRDVFDDAAKRAADLTGRFGATGRPCGRPADRATIRASRAEAARKLEHGRALSSANTVWRPVQDLLRAGSRT